MTNALQRMAQRADTAANWTSANPTLAVAEIGYESDTGREKIGDGSAAWNSLPYRGAVAPDWAPNTPYRANNLVIQGGVLQRRKTAGTSGATFDQTQWDKIGATSYDLGWVPADNGLVAANMHPASIGGGTLMVAGRDYAAKIKARAGTAIGGYVSTLNAAGSADTAGYYAALYDATGALAAQTADISTILRSTAPTIVAFTASYTPATDGYVYLVIHTGTATTQPRLSTTSAAAVVMNMNLSGTSAGPSAPRFFLSGNTWAGATPPATLGTLSTSNPPLPYFAGLAAPTS